MGRSRQKLKGVSEEEIPLFASMQRAEKLDFLKGHQLLQTCSKDQPESLPKVGELVWARVSNSAYWPGFILQLEDVDCNDDGADDIDDTAYGFVMFLESTFRHAPVSWEQIIPFQDLETQVKLLPHFNKMIVKKNWKPTSFYKNSLEMAVEFSKIPAADRLKNALSRYEQRKKASTTKPKPSTPAPAPITPKQELPPAEAISKVMSAVREKKKSGIRVSERITKKQIVKLKPKPEPKSTAKKKTESTSDDKAAAKSPKASNKNNKNPRPDIGGEVLKQWTRDRFNKFSKQHIFESSNVQCGECDVEITSEEPTKTCHGIPFHENCLIKHGTSVLKCKMCINQLCFLCKKPSEEKHKTLKCSRCELRFHIDCLLKDWPQAEIQGSNGPITCPVHFCHTCLGEQKIHGKFRDYTTNSSRSYKCKLCLSTYHKNCLPAGCGESMQGKEFIICPKHTLPELKVHQRRIGCLCCFKPLKPKDEKVECSYCIQTFHPECVGYTGDIKSSVTLNDFGQGYKCFTCKWGLFPLYGQVIWFQQPQSQYWPARILFPAEHKGRKRFAKRLPGQYSIEYFGTTCFYDNASRGLPLHLTTVDIFKSMKVYQEVPKILRAHEEAAFCFMFSDEYRDKQLAQPKPVYKKIEKNLYRTFSVHKVKEPSDICSCSEEKTELVCQADSGCTNRDMEMECSDRICKGGERCCNRMFSERKNDEEFLEQKLFPNKGWGVIAKKAFKPGDFVAEYRGEVIDRNEMKWRLSKKEEEDPMYILEISKEFFIDAEYVGNLSRLINHSCDPNGEVRKYLSMGRSVGGIFARRPIKVGEEITFRYGCGSQSTAPFRCRCGASNCTVFVGKNVPDNYMIEDDPEQDQDKWEDVCSKCGYGGRVICCEFPACGKVWHYQCLKLSRQPSKNWCCPDHPPHKVAQLQKSIESRNKSNRSRSKIAHGKSNLNSSTSNISSKSTTQQQTKKKSRQSAQPALPIVVSDAATMETTGVVIKLEVGVPQKRKLSTTSTAPEQSLQPAQKKQRSIGTTTKADAQAQTSPQQPAPTELRQYRRSLRSSKSVAPDKLTPTHDAPSISKITKESKVLEVIPKTLKAPTTMPITNTSVETRRRRAQSIPANGFNFNVPSTPNTRSKRDRRGESVNERTSVSKKLAKESPHNLLPEASSKNEVLTTHGSSNKFICSDLDASGMSRRRSRNSKATEPLTPMALNPYVRPRESTPVNLSNALISSDKHVRMGTRSSSVVFYESPFNNQINGQDDASADFLVPDTPVTNLINLNDIKQEPEDEPYTPMIDFSRFDDESYKLQRSLEQTKNKNSKPRRTFDGNDDGSTISSARNSAFSGYEVTDNDSDLQIVYIHTRPTFPRQQRQYCEEGFPL